MASSNDRKISQLNYQSTLSDDSNFLIVNGITTTPRNERISTIDLFKEIPTAISVGSALNGRDVTFNSTPSAKQFYFEAATGDVTVGHDLTVSNDVNVTGDLNVTGIATFNNPVLVNLDLPGNLNVNGTVDFQTTLATAGLATLESLTVTNATTLSSTLNVAGISTFTANTNHTNVFASYLNSTNSDLTNITATQIDTTDITVANDLNIAGNVIANGYIQAIGNIFGNVGNFNELHLTANGKIDDTLTANNVIVNLSLTTPSFTTISFTSQDIVATNNTTTKTLDANVANLTSSTITLLNATDALVSNTLTSLNLNATNLTVTTGSITNLTSSLINATDVITSNSVSTVTSVSTENRTNQLKFNVYTSIPSYSSFDVGTIILYDDATYMRLLVATSTGWQEIYFT